MNDIYVVMQNFITNVVKALSRPYIWNYVTNTIPLPQHTINEVVYNRNSYINTVLHVVENNNKESTDNQTRLNNSHIDTGINAIFKQQSVYDQCNVLKFIIQNDRFSGHFKYIGVVL